VATLLLALALGGCSTGSKTVAPSGNRPVAPPRTSGPAAAPLSPSQYFSEATAIDLFQLRAADIALQRGSGHARSFAVESRRQHEAIAAQMSFAGRYLNLLPSRTLPTEYQQMLSSLLSASNFDSLYLDQERAICGRALKLHRNYASNGGSPTLRPVAQFAENAVSSELKALAR
jgi:putative membrane protein